MKQSYTKNIKIKRGTRKHFRGGDILGEQTEIRSGQLFLKNRLKGVLKERGVQELDQ